MKYNDILSKVDHQSGMTVPEGYFENFAHKMAASLPEQEWERPSNEMPRSMWHKVRPYLYMAAMFMGVWCMMKMFDLMRPSNEDFGIENNSILAEAVSNDAFINDYYTSSVDDGELLDELYADGFTPTSFH